VRSFIRTRLRRTLVGIPLVVALLAMSVSLSGCKSFFDKRPASRTMATPAPRVRSGAEKFAAASDTLSTSLEAATRAFERGSTDATAIAAVRRFAADLPKLDKGVAADFAKTRKILTKVKSADKDAIQARVERTYAERKAALASRLSAVTSAETTAALRSSIAATAEYLDSITPEEPYQPLGTSLPHRIVDAKAGPPVLGAKIAPAYAPNTPGAEPSTLPVTPTPEDTTQTVEVQFTPEITSLVASLGADPVRMYEYVRNTIDFEPYYGSRKGATETLLEGSGNDIDTASLLIALYRKAGIPARYVSGVVDVPIEKAMNWVGVETPEAAAKLFSAGGTPTKLGISGGKPKALQIEHTWAEVYVDYEDYRGAGAGSGEKVWVPLDVSWKSYKVLPRIQLDTSAIDPAAMMSALASGSIETSDSITKCDLNAARDAMQSAAATLSASITTSPSVEQLLNIRPIVRERLGVLPPVTPLRAVSVDSEWAAVPTTMQRRVSASLPGGSTFTTALAGLSAKRLTVSFLGSTQADRDLMASYERIEDVPAYQIEVTPRISLDGEVVATGDPVALGSPLDVSLAATGPNGTDPFTSAVTAGGFYALVLDAGPVSPEAFRGHADRYGEAVASVQSMAAGDTRASVDPETLMGEMLHSAGLAYFTQLDAAYQMLSGPWRVASTQMLAEGTVGTSLATSAFLGTVSSVRPTGVSLDVRRDARVVQSAADDSEMESGYFQAAGGIGSFLEGRMIEQVFGLEGISTVRVLQIANNSAIPILAIDSSNSELIDTLDYGAALKADLRDAVATGNRIVIPKVGIEYYGYCGTGWIVTDPETGASGYMIAGGLAGGQSTNNSGGSGSGSGADLNPFAATPAYAASPNGATSPSSSNGSPNGFSAMSSFILLAISAIASALENPWPSRVLAAAGAIASLAAANDAYRVAVEFRDSSDSRDERLVGYAMFCAALQLASVFYLGVSLNAGGVQAALIGVTAIFLLTEALPWLAAGRRRAQSPP